MKKSTVFGLAAGLALFAATPVLMADEAGEGNAPIKVAYTLNPASGTVESISSITIDFTENRNVAYYENSKRAIATLSNGLTGNDELAYFCYEPTRLTRAESEGAVYEFVFVDEDGEAVVVNTPGNWTLTVAGFYTEGENGEIENDVETITAEYTINYPVAYTLTPAAGTVEDLSTVSIEFDNFNVGFYDVRPGIATIENLETGDTYFATSAVRDTHAEADGAVYNFTFSELGETEPVTINQPGNYLLTIKGAYLGDLEVEASDLPVITANYTIEYPVEYTLTPAAGTSVESLSTITLTFPETLVAFYDQTRPAVATLENLETGDAYYCFEPQAEYIMDEETNGAGIEFRMTFYEIGSDEVAVISQPGNYRLTVRGLYTGDEEGEPTMDLPVITANYTIDYPVEYTLTPADNSAVESITAINLTFPNTLVAFYEQTRPAVATLENVATGDAYYCYEPQAEYIMDEETNGAGIEYRMTFYEIATDEVAVISQPGEYLLTVRGLYVGDEEGEPTMDLPVITARYTIPYPVEYVLTPASESAVEEISSVSIEFPNSKLVAYYENSTMPIATLTNGLLGDEEVAYYCYEPVRNTKAESEGIVYEFVFVDEDEEVVTINQPGNWYLTIRGLYTFSVDEDGMVEDSEVALPVINAVYTINYPVAYGLNPADGSSVEEISNITIDFFNNMNVAYYENSTMPIATLTNGLTGDDEIAYYCYEPTRLTRAESEGAVYEFVFLDEDEEVVTINQPGKWYLTIRGFYTEVVPAEGEEDQETEKTDLPVINATYMVVNPAEYVLNPATGSTVAEISSVTIDFVNNKNVAYYENSTMPIATLTNGLLGDEEVVFNCYEPTRLTRAESEGAVYEFVFLNEEDEAVTVATDGTWILTIRGFYLADEDGEPMQDLPVIAAIYYIDTNTGISSAIKADSYDVYTINGMKVISNGDVNSLNTLTSGLYIINGKKVYLRK